MDRRVVVWTERSLLFLLVLYLFLHTLPRAWNRLNTDFPNYYIAARLVHEHYDTSRMYEWIWLQREKDHRAIDDKAIGLVPITPFSTLFVWPVAELPPLTAKQIWIVGNLLLLIPLAWMLRSMTGLNYRRVALIFALSFPLHRNLLYGQFYIFLLFLIVAACWAWMRTSPAVSGASIAVATACKIFPALFLVFFLRRRSWRAVVSSIAILLACLAISIGVFGENLLRTYFQQVLPWALRGECLPPYAIASASTSSVLHRLLLYEPQWNPHPWHGSVLAYSLLQPTLAILVLAPAILLIDRRNRTNERVLLEWSALLVAALTASTMTASYDFVLLVLPVCVLAARFLQRKQIWMLGLLLVVYVGIGFPMPSPGHISGPAILLYVPRLPLMFGLLYWIYALLWRDTASTGVRRGREQFIWTVALATFLLFGIVHTWHVESGMRREYAYRLKLPNQGMLNAYPRSNGLDIQYVTLTMAGYHLLPQQARTTGTDAHVDVLSFTSDGSNRWVERAQSPRPKIVDESFPASTSVRDARDPMSSQNGGSLAFIRDDHGRGRLIVRRNFRSTGASEVALSPESLNVYEASFLSEKEYAFSAPRNGGSPQIFLTDSTHHNSPLALGSGRYPALSPDGRWLAYSRLDHGVWNLWLRSESTGSTRRISTVPCNEIQPFWESDSKTLLYGTDCGRSLWFTAIARRRVVP